MRWSVRRKKRVDKWVALEMNEVTMIKMAEMIMERVKMTTFCGWKRSTTGMKTVMIKKMSLLKDAIEKTLLSMEEEEKRWWRCFQVCAYKEGWEYPGAGMCYAVLDTGLCFGIPSQQSFPHLAHRRAEVGARREKAESLADQWPNCWSFFRRWTRFRAEAMTKFATFWAVFVEFVASLVRFFFEICAPS